MAPLTLEGDTLGEKHRHFNKLVEDAVADKHFELRNISADDSDIDNLLKIDIACKTRNVDYIFEVIKSNDMLYAATAIKKSTWLITEQQYADIINPEYLHTQLAPNMNTKTFNKLMLHIRLNLKDEARVESFYEYLNGKENSYKWLPNCSIPFIENVIQNEHLIPLSLFKRLCRRSPNLIAYYKRVLEDKDNPVLSHASKQEIMYYVKSHTDHVMDDTTYIYRSPKFGEKNTKFLMKACSQKVFDNFDKFVKEIDLSVAARYLDKKEIITFLKKQVSTDSAYYLFEYDQLGHFIRNMPEYERFEFVRKTFITKTELAEFFPEYESRFTYVKPYKWYEFAPFNVALPELKKLIRKETSSSERCDILSVLITCARGNAQHIKTLLEFVKDEHINEPLKFKVQFVNNLLSQISTHTFDVETWNMLDQLFISMDVYTESEHNVQLCLQSIVMYKVLHDEPVPEIIEHKMQFNTFEKVHGKLNREEKDKIFGYLLNSVLTKVQNLNVANKSNFNDTKVHLETALSLLKHWNKDIRKYPFVLEKIRKLIKAKQENKWETDLSCLYNVRKSWRKHMFEESLSLCLSEEACLNALKHKPQLLTRHEKQIDTLRTDDAVSLPRLLAKLRVYWPHSLAQHWVDAYLLNLNKTIGQKAVIKSLFMLLHQKEIIDIAKKYKPDEIKVNSGDTDQNEITIRKNIAKHLHKARPQIPLEVVLWYAKGDYLQSTEPSLKAILLNLSESEIREYLPKILDAPVSLQKFGLSLAVSKLKSDDLKSTLSKIWKTSKNLTIRSALFMHLYDEMCEVYNARVEKELWDILSSFIDNLTAQDDAEIYKKIGNVYRVPISIRTEFYMKSYEFLISLPAGANCEIYSYLKDLIDFSLEIMGLLDSDFVVNKMLSPVGTTFCSNGSLVLDVFASYILYGKSEEEQLRRFRRVGEPAIDEAFRLWNTVRSGKYYVRDNFSRFLQSLVRIFKIYYLSDTVKTVPVKLFVKIKTKMEKELPLLENYVLCTSWKLVTNIIKIVNDQKLVFSSNEPHIFTDHWMSYVMEITWKDLFSKITPSVSPMIVKWLKEDLEQYNFSLTYFLITETLKKMFNLLLADYHGDAVVLETLRLMLNDSDFIPAYIVVSKLTSGYTYWSHCKPMRTEITKIMKSHPSKEVRMHYFNDFQNIRIDNDANDL